MRKKAALKKAAAAVMAVMLLAGASVTANAEPLQTETENAGVEVSETETEETGLETVQTEPQVQMLSEEKEETTKVEYLNVAGKEIIAYSKMTGETYPGVSYDDEACTLILDNANIIGQEMEGNVGLGSVIYMTLASGVNKITVELRGENTISLEDSENLSVNDVYSLFSCNNTDNNLAEVTFQGGGTLNLKVTENMRVGIGLSAYDTNATRLLIKDCTVNIDMRLDEDDWFMGIRGAAELNLQSAELNILAEEGSSGSIWGVVNDAAVAESHYAAVKTKDSKLHFRGANAQYNYGFYNPIKAEFTNSDIYLECLGPDSAPLCLWYEECAVSIDARTTFQWLQTDNMNWMIGMVDFDIADSLDIYSRKTSQETWEGQETLDNVIGTDEETGETVIYGSFMLSPSESEKKGDLNGDGTINLLDVSVLLDYTLDASGLSEEEKEAADLNEDGLVNLLDVSYLLDMVLV